jgi:PAS domain S-box-containing protein
MQVSDPGISSSATPLASDAELRMLTDAMPHILWTAGADGSCSYLNQKFLDYSGLSMEHGLAAGWAHLLHAGDSERVARLWQHALATGEHFEAECRLRRGDGAYRWMLGRALPHLQPGAAGTGAAWLGTFTDIDGLKQTATSLEQNLFMNQVAGRVARMGGWTIDLPDRTLSWSDENCLIHDVPPGYKPTLQEGIGYFLPEDRETVRKLVQACVEHGTAYEFVLPKMTAKGRRIWVRSLGEAVRDADGKVVRLQGAFQDITEQKEAEARMHALELTLITTLESITDGFYLLDKDWKFSYINGPAERMLETRRSDILGKSLWQQFPAALNTPFERECKLAATTQRSRHFESFSERLQTWFDCHVYPTEVGIAVYFQDITQTRLEHAQLRLLDTAVSRLNDIVIITEANAFEGADRRIVFVNDAFERHTGYSREEAVGKTTSILWGAATQQAELDRIGAAMDKWQAVRTEIVIYTKAGAERWLETDIAPIADESGKFTHWVGVERDITERKRQQEEILSLNTQLEERVLLRTAELARANNEMESFAYSVSHDLRSPLNTINAFSQLLLKDDAEHISEKGRHYLDRIRAAAAQMGGLIEGLLTLAQLSRGRIRSETVDLSAIARLIDRDLREREPLRQVEVQVKDGLSAHGDPRLLLAVMQNLLGNAWKFSAGQPLARIEVGSQTGPGGDSVFFVKDNGAGFDMAFAHKLFGTFERLHSPGEFAGTGIGLATVKRVIDRHGGKVWAESKLTEGASFYFTLSRPPAAMA